MTVRGHVENGLIVLDEEVPLPEGVAVTIEFHPRQTPLHNPYGLLADDPTGITEEDIAEVRREFLANFPREDV